ncbi:hypothetical protein [Candidatus Uabimicrobium amorphum]|uniref:Uncharacterized protein n=1 Tax=Uabimicrobium amorphum TaxID=2596890 RepID=A0A5S9F228_UABAM|nr:hypothetical protein [Candidatus Uabimicrobium amorphum]BBM82683.1 hypothetical protein UABAM_01026 [Candidatus Uabimicrobium amorphum]
MKKLLVCMICAFLVMNVSADNKLKLKNVDKRKFKNASTEIQSAINWLKKPTPGYKHQVFFHLAYMETPAKWVGFCEGQLLLNKSKTKLSTRGGSAKVYFSDRRWDPKKSGGLLPTKPQLFDYRKAEKWNIELHSNGKMFLHMITWKQKFTIALSLRGGVLYGSVGRNVVIVSLKKSKYMIPK